MENFWSSRFKEMDTPKVVDLSTCFSVEASGDSDQLDNINDHNHLSASVKDDDDAESCSCDVSDYYSCVSDRRIMNGFDGNEGFDEMEEEEEEEEEYDDDDDEEQKIHHHGYHQQTWGVDGIFGLSVNHQKSRVSVESTNEPMNEMEKDRLFWETCLAS